MATTLAERSFSRFLVPAIGIGIVTLLGVIFVADNPLYQKLLTAWMLHPFPHPFIDWQFIPAAAECWSHGVNVYIATPCYDLVPTMTHPYSPLWLRFSFLPSDPASVAVFGVGWALLFWAAQAYLPPPRTRRELELTLLVALSSLSAFALERGNIDIVIFLLAILGTMLWLGSLQWRLLAYAIFLFAGLLKFYPLVLLFLVVRERPRIFWPVTITATIVAGISAFEVRDELIAVSHNIPKGPYFTDLFGAINLPFGFPVLAGYVGSKIAGVAVTADSFSWIRVPAYLALVVLALAGAAGLAFRAGFREAIAALSERRQAFLIVGSALLCGCFFAGQNVGYRGIFLILLLPGLFQLRVTLPRLGSRCVRSALYAIVFVAWVLTLEWISRGQGLTRGYPLDLDGFGLLHWVLHEVSWWWIVTIMLATLMSFAANSAMGVWASSLINTRPSAVTA